MSLARQLATLLDSGGDVVSGQLDNIPTVPADWNTLLNKPATLQPSATTDTTNAANLSSGSLSLSRLSYGGSPSSSTYLRGDMQWITNCTTHPNCTSSNCVCACQCNC